MPIHGEPASLDELLQRIGECENPVWRPRFRAAYWKDPNRTAKKLGITLVDAYSTIIKRLRKEDLREGPVESDKEGDSRKKWIFRTRYSPPDPEKKRVLLYIKISSDANGVIWIESFHINENKNWGDLPQPNSKRIPA